MQNDEPGESLNDECYNADDQASSEDESGAGLSPAKRETEIEIVKQPKQETEKEAPAASPKKAEEFESSSEEEEAEAEGDSSEGEDDEQFEGIKTGEMVEVSPKGRFKRFSAELGSGAYKKVYKGIDEDTGAEIAWNVISLKSLPKSKPLNLTSSRPEADPNGDQHHQGTDAPEHHPLRVGLDQQREGRDRVHHGNVHGRVSPPVLVSFQEPVTEGDQILVHRDPEGPDVPPRASVPHHPSGYQVRQHLH
jgi:hypothetical protein